MRARHMCAAFIVSVTTAAVAAQAPVPQADSPRFEVASVRVAPPGVGGNMSPFGQNRWTAGCVPLGLLVSMAFDATHIEGLPSWTECYSVAAKAEDGVVLTPEAFRPRMKQLLAERFKLVA